MLKPSRVPGTLAIHLERIKKVFDNHVVAIDDVSMTIQEGEFFSLLGPISGGRRQPFGSLRDLRNPAEGTVYIQGRDVTRVPPHKRDTGMVFQNYASTARSLKTSPSDSECAIFQRKRQKSERGIKLVEMEGLGDRRPSQLSGGQQQRVALAPGHAYNCCCKLL